MWTILHWINIEESTSAAHEEKRNHTLVYSKTSLHKQSQDPLKRDHNFSEGKAMIPKKF